MSGMQLRGVAEEWLPTMSGNRSPVAKLKAHVLTRTLRRTALATGLARVRRGSLASLVAITLGGLPLLVAQPSASASSPRTDLSPPSSRAVGSTATYCTTYGASGTKAPYSFDNVYACSPDDTKGSTPFDGNYNQSFQCEDLSIRFLWVVDGIWAGPGVDRSGVGYGKGGDLAQFVHRYIAPSVPLGSPGPGSVPSSGDVISFLGGVTDTNPGHTAVVVSSSPSSGIFETMSENFPIGQAGEQEWEVDLSGKHNGDVEFIGTPGHEHQTGLWSSSKWLELTGSVGTDVSGRVAIGVNANGALQVFMIGDDGEVYTKWLTSKGTWTTAWSGIGGDFPTGDAIGVATNTTGKLQIFAVAGNGEMLSNYQQAPDSYASWHPWSKLGPTALFTPGLTALTAEENQNGEPEVFAVAANGTVVTSARSTAGAWSTWKTLGSGFAVNRVLAVSANASGKLQIYALTSTGSLYSDLEAAPDMTSTWLGFKLLTATTPSFPYGIGSFVALNENGKPQLFQPNASGQVETSYLTAGWSPFFSIGGLVNSGTRLSAALTSKGRLWLFGLKSNGELLSTLEGGSNTQTKWSSWSQFDGVAAPAGDDIAVASDANGKLRVLFVGSGGALDTAAQSSPTVWGGIQSLGGSWPNES